MRGISMKKKNRMLPVFGIFLAVLCLCMGTSVFAEGEEQSSEERNTVYFCYYLNQDTDRLLAEEYIPEQEETEFMLKDLMQLLNSKNSRGQKIDLLPEDVIINSYELKGEMLVIDFDPAYKKMSRVRELLVRAGVVKTFLDVPGIEGVKFTIEGEELLDSKGRPYGEMTKDTFVEYSGSSDVSEYCFDTLTLYFTDASGKLLVPEERNVYYKRTLQKERVVLEQLARGPMVKDNYPTIPANLSIQSVMVSDEICYITVDDSFIDYANKKLPAEIPVYSVVNSILASCPEKKVELTVGEKDNRIFGDSLPLYKYYEFNQDLVILE